MSWEYMCEVCGKIIRLDWKAEGCQMICHECEELQ
jgi:hypothetical protein